MQPDIKYFPSIIIGRFIEIYNTAPGKFISNVLKDLSGNGKTIRQARFMVSADCTVTVIDVQNGPATDIVVKAGVEYRFPVSQITAITGGAKITIFHDGETVD